MVKNEYYSGQGKLFIAPIRNGQVGSYRFLGNVPNLEVNVEIDKTEHKESHSGKRLTDFTLTKEVKTGFSATLEELSTENMALAFQGTVVNEIGTKVTDELIKSANVGDVIFLSGIGFSDLKIKDSTTTSAVNLVEGEHYSVDAAYGRVTILKTDGLTLPLKASFTKAATKRIDFMTENVEGYSLKFLGLNTANSDAPVMVEMTKVALDPAKTWALINDELGQLEITGNVLAVNGKTITVTKIVR